MNRDHITGLVLAGGKGSRMGGLDKGLQPYRGTPLALHALRRLAPQVGRTLLNANRHLDVYGRFGVPVWPDASPDFPGPLAGFLAGLAHCETTWLATVPCDSPLFPADLVARLARRLQDHPDAVLAVARTGGRIQPVFALMRASLRDDLANYTGSGGSKVETWMGRHRTVEVNFDDESAFFNANTLEELRSIEQHA